MAFKFVVFAALVAVARAGAIGAPAAVAYAAPAAIAKTVQYEEPYDPNPQYSYAYDVHDGLSGDTKSQSESRQGDVVQGSYSLVEPDGSRRTVEYTADPVNGFNAVVHKDAGAAVVKTVAAAPAVAYAAPAITKTVAAAPVAYAAPAVHAVHAAPYAYAPAATYTKTVAAAPAIAYSSAPAVYTHSFSSPHVTYTH